MHVLHHCPHAAGLVPTRDLFKALRAVKSCRTPLGLVEGPRSFLAAPPPGTLAASGGGAGDMFAITKRPAVSRRQSMTQGRELYSSSSSASSGSESDFRTVQQPHAQRHASPHESRRRSSSGRHHRSRSGGRTSTPGVCFGSAL